MPVRLLKHLQIIRYNIKYFTVVKRFQNDENAKQLFWVNLPELVDLTNIPYFV